MRKLKMIPVTPQSEIYDQKIFGYFIIIPSLKFDTLKNIAIILKTYLVFNDE